MRKIDVRDYEFMGQAYKVKDAMISVLMHPELRLGAVEVLKRNKLGERILETEELVSLEEEDYNRLKSAFESIQGFSRADVELVQRVLEAKEEVL